MTEMSKGTKMLLSMIGVTPEMLANPAELMKQFGINPDAIFKQVAEFQQIGLRLEAQLNQIGTRLARIERELGISDAEVGHGADDGGTRELDTLDAGESDRRN